MPSIAPLTADTRLAARKQLPLRVMGDETVVVEPKLRKVFLMNRVAAAIWAEVERGATVAEIVERLVERFRVDRERAFTDVAMFVGQLEAAQLAERRP